MKLLKKNKRISLFAAFNLICSLISVNGHAQETTQHPSLSPTEIQQKISVLDSAVKQMNSTKKRMIADIAGHLALGAVISIPIVVAITAATGGIGFGIGFALGAGTPVAAGVVLALISSFISGAVAIGASTAVGLGRLIALSVIFKTLGETIINKKPLAFILFTLPTRNAFRRLRGLDEKQKELNELLTFEKNNPGIFDKTQQKIITSYQQKLKDPLFVGAFKAFAEQDLLIKLIRKAIELDSSLKTIIKNDPEKTAKMIAKYIVLNRNFGNYMAALNELAYDKKKREIFRLRGLARTKVSLQFKATQKQIAKIEKNYPQLIRLKNELVGMYRKESRAIDEKYNEMIKSK